MNPLSIKVTSVSAVCVIDNNIYIFTMLTVQNGYLQLKCYLYKLFFIIEKMLTSCNLEYIIIWLEI